MESKNPEEYIGNLDKNSKKMIEHGFDPKKRKQTQIVYLGMLWEGINTSYEDFMQRLKMITRFEKINPGYLRRCLLRSRIFMKF